MKFIFIFCIISPLINGTEVHGKIMSESRYDHWFFKKVLSEFPIIGSFFKKTGWRESFQDAGKCTAMFAGGATAMIYNMYSSPENNVSKNLSSMALGMWAGKVIYNFASDGCGKLRKGCGMLYQFSLKERSLSSFTESSELHEREALNSKGETLTNAEALDTEKTNNNSIV